MPRMLTEVNGAGKELRIFRESAEKRFERNELYDPEPSAFGMEAVCVRYAKECASCEFVAELVRQARAVLPSRHGSQNRP